ncbi:carbonic anhydrase [Paraburkholderia graminis]|nr:carbonic anhydrase family protein [Paraburkholderia graminis]
MKLSKYLVLLGSLCVTLSHAADPHASTARWSYQGETGPAHWGELSPDNAACRDGYSQSPIDLRHERAQHGRGRNFQFHYRPSVFSLVNNGHTIQASAADAANALDSNDDAYTLKQFHFHTPSEHEVNGRRYPMELHLVHQDGQGNLTVVGVFIKEGRKNTALAPLFNRLPAEGEAARSVTIDPAALLPDGYQALRYVGSLTTPPCTEQVNWIVLEKPIELSKAQIAAFRKLFPNNHRDVKPDGGREVDEE